MSQEKTGKNKSEDNNEMKNSQEKNGKEKSQENNNKKESQGNNEKKNSQEKNEKKKSQEKNEKKKSQENSKKKKSQKKNDDKKSQENNFNKKDLQLTQKFSPDELSPWTSLPSDLEEKILDLTGPIQLEASEIRQQEPVRWSYYLEEDVLSDREYNFIQVLQNSESRDERDAIFKHYKDQAYLTLRKLVLKIINTSDMQKFLVMFNDIIWEDKDRIAELKPETSELWSDLLPLLQIKDNFVQNIGSRIITFIVFHSKKGPHKADERVYLTWLKEELKVDNPYLQSVARCLQMLLRMDEYRTAFMTLSGVFRIVGLLREKMKPQAQYQFSYCLWVTSFNPQLAEKLNRSGTIPILADVLFSCPTEIVKLPRVIIATYRNLLEKPRETGVKKHNALVMIQCKISKYLANMEQKIHDTNDPEYVEDFEAVLKILNDYCTEMSSFDEYQMEVRSGRLEWSMVHNSKKFWIDNAERLNEHKFELLKILISLLESSADNVVLCIAAHDLGEYMKHFGRGKKIVEDLGGKDALIRLLGHKHPAVKYYVLKTLQIIMLTNYHLFTEYQTVKL